MKKKFKMPRNRTEFEQALVSAFQQGMVCGYAVEHTELSSDEKVYANRFRALVQGEIQSMSEIVNEEKTYSERNSGGGIYDDARQNI